MELLECLGSDHLMKSPLASSLVALALAGCVVVPVPSETYFPQGFGIAPAMKRCAPARLYARLFERGDVTLDVSIREGRDFWGSLQLRGPARFLDSQMTVREYDFAAPVSVELKDCIPRGPVDGLHECAFETRIMAPEISVSFPPLEVEGSRRELPPIRFLKQGVRSMCVMSLEQLGQQ